MPFTRFTSRVFPLLCAGLLLASCKGVPGNDTVDVSRSIQTPFTASADITLNEMEAKATIERPSGADCTVRFTSPEALSGVLMQLRGEELTVELGDIGFTLAQQRLPISPVPRLVTQILGSAGVQAKKTGGGVAALSGVGEMGGVLVEIDIESGAILKIAAPEAGFSAIFSDFVFTDSP